VGNQKVFNPKKRCKNKVKKKKRFFYLKKKKKKKKKKIKKFIKN